MALQGAAKAVFYTAQAALQEDPWPAVHCWTSALLQAADFSTSLMGLWDGKRRNQ
jgi:hypothetical protein